MSRTLLAAVFCTALGGVTVARADDPPATRCTTPADCTFDPHLHDAPLIITPPYAYRYFIRALAGVTASPQPVLVGWGSALEIGSRPFFGAFSTGLSISAQSAEARWVAATVGLMAELDLTYVALTQLWDHPPPRDAPVIVRLGVRIGLGYTTSYPDRSHGDARSGLYMETYTLVRIELQPYLDVQWTFSKKRDVAVFLRGAIDTAVNLSDVFRGSVLLGLTYEWDDE